VFLINERDTIPNERFQHANRPIPLTAIVKRLLSSTAGALGKKSVTRLAAGEIPWAKLGNINVRTAFPGAISEKFSTFAPKYRKG
jgi:hypothetical protein